MIEMCVPVQQNFVIFLVTLMAASGNQTTMLNAGPLPAAEVVLPVGEFALYAEVYDEANAYGVYQVGVT
jgi:hypothetical protein